MGGGDDKQGLADASEGPGFPYDETVEVEAIRDRAADGVETREFSQGRGGATWTVAPPRISPITRPKRVRALLA